MDLSAQQQNILTQLNAVSPIGQSVLGDMIDEEIIRQEAAASGISGHAQEVEAAIQASFRYFPQGTTNAVHNAFAGRTTYALGRYACPRHHHAHARLHF